ncbi:MAG: hypothetical protein QM753_19845 [Thermomicrobiales bacterium]
MAQGRSGSRNTRTTRRAALDARRSARLVVAVLLGVMLAAPFSAMSLAAEAGGAGLQRISPHLTQETDDPDGAADPTEAVPTDVPPTEIPPTEIPPTDVPPTELPTETLVPTETATAEPTAPSTPSPTTTASPTIMPSPAVAWSLSPDLVCETEADAVVSGGSIVYVCRVAATVVAGAAPNLALELQWDVTTDGRSDDWSIEVRPSDAEAWSDAGDGTPLEIVDAFTTGSGTSTQTLARPLTFDLQLTRASCVTTDPPIAVRISASITAPHASTMPIAATGSTTRDATVTPVLAAIPEPSISFLGPLTFGQVSLPSNEQVAVQASTAVLLIDGLDQSCGIWTIAVEGGSLSAGGGRVLEAANVQLISVNGQLAPSSPCGLDEACVVAVIAAGPNSLSSLQLTLGFQVIVPADAPLGALQALVTATIFRGTALP